MLRETPIGPRTITFKKGNVHMAHRIKFNVRLNVCACKVLLCGPFYLSVGPFFFVEVKEGVVGIMAAFEALFANMREHCTK